MITWSEQSGLKSLIAFKDGTYIGIAAQMPEDSSLWNVAFINNGDIVGLGPFRSSKVAMAALEYEYSTLIVGDKNNGS